MNPLRGETSVEMGGRLRALKFGTNATALFCSMHKVSLAGFGELFSAGNITPAHYRDLIYCALVSGQRGTPVDFTPEDVGDWIDDMSQESLEGVFAVVGESSARSDGGKPTP
jgi:hypothetical protein